MIPELITSLACVTCMNGQSEAEMAQSLAVVFMLLLLGGVFVGIFRFMNHLRSCAKNAGKRP